MIVVFLYVTSLATNTKVIFQAPSTYLLFVGVFILAFNFSLAANLGTKSLPYQLFNDTAQPILLSLIIYLLLTLVAATKITESFKGALTELF